MPQIVEVARCFVHTSQAAFRDLTSHVELLHLLQQFPFYPLLFYCVTLFLFLFSKASARLAQSS